MKSIIDKYATSASIYKNGQKKTTLKALNLLPIKVSGFAIYECPRCGAIYKMYIHKNFAYFLAFSIVNNYNSGIIICK